MAPRAAFLSFRFGPTDGVSAVTRTWVDAFEDLGFRTVTVAGEGDAARLVGGFGLDATSTPDEDALRDALVDVDVVVVENLLTIPINLPASRVAARVLAGRPAVIHHHDPPWHRERFAHITELPVTDPAWRHVAITRILAGELAERGIDATVIHNGFATPLRRSAEEAAAIRRTVRAAVGLAEDEIVVLHPVRAIERKNVAAAIELAEGLGATYWLLGPPEEGYAETLGRLLSAARCPVLHHPWPDVDEAYVASDHVAFPSTWEGFGNPPIEASLRRRTVTVGNYPVAAELRAHGFDWFGVGDLDAVRATLRDLQAPATVELLDRNERIAREHFGLEPMRAILRALLDEAGWLP